MFFKMNTFQKSTKSAPVELTQDAASSSSSQIPMIQLTQKILTCVSKLADRDTQQIAVDDLVNIVTQSLPSDGVPMFLNCLYDALNDPKPAVKRETLRLFSVLCSAHTPTAATHLTKIISQIVKRLKDADPQVRDASIDTIGSLARLYLNGGDAALFVKPLLEAMNENNKSSQCGAALGLAKVVDCATVPPLTAFHKLLPRVCKYLNSPNFMAKPSLLHLASRLAQVGAVTSQNVERLQRSVHTCLFSSDWGTRKAAADTLAVLASGLKTRAVITKEAATSTLKMLETCRFDKVKPVRDSMNEALDLWKKIAGNAVDDSNTLERVSSYPKSGDKGHNILDKAVQILKKKTPALNGKELNLEFFFSKLDSEISGDLPVEVILPRRCVSASSDSETKKKGSEESGAAQNEILNNGHDGSMDKVNSSGLGARETEGFVDNGGDWLAVQAQLSLLQRQQAHLMSMLQDFVGGSHDNMVTLGNRVRGLEKVVEDMIRDLSSKTSSTCLADGSHFSMCNGFSGYGRRGNEIRRMELGERCSWRSDVSNSWNMQHEHEHENEHAHVRNGSGSRRAAPARFFDEPAGKSLF